MKLVGICGSLRENSFNLKLLQSAQKFLPTDVTMSIESLSQIPLYNEDDEQKTGVPLAVQKLKKLIADSDGVLIASPEYNFSVSGVMKNAIDWASRPPKDIAPTFGNKPVAVIGASAGPGGSRLGQMALLPVLRTLGTQSWSGRQFFMAMAASQFDASGNIIDEKTKLLLEKYVTEFVQFCKNVKSAH